MHDLQYFLFLVPDYAPFNISLSSKSSTEIFIQWQHLSAREANGVIRGYNVYFQDLNRTKIIQNITVPAENTTTILRKLSKYTLYKIQLQAFTKYGGGNFSRNFTCRTLEDGKIILV